MEFCNQFQSFVSTLCASSTESKAPLTILTYAVAQWHDPRSTGGRCTSYGSRNFSSLLPSSKLHCSWETNIPGMMHTRNPQERRTPASQVLSGSLSWGPPISGLHQVWEICLSKQRCSPRKRRIIFHGLHHSAAEEMREEWIRALPAAPYVLAAMWEGTPPPGELIWESNPCILWLLRFVLRPYLPSQILKLNGWRRHETLSHPY